MDNKIIYSVIICVIIYFFYKKIKTKEGFKNNSAFSGNIVKTNLASLGNIDSNPQIERDGSNVLTIPSGEFGQGITIGNHEPGWIPPSKHDIDDEKSILPYLIVDLKKIMKVKAVATSGVYVYRIYASRYDNKPGSFDPVLQINHATKKKTLHMDSPDINKIVVRDNLITQSNEDVFARYIKLEPLNPKEISKTGIYTFENKNEGSDNQAVDQTKGLKLEIFAHSGAAKIMNGGNSLLGNMKLYNENGLELNGNKWVAETGNQSPYCKIIFHDNGQTIPKAIYSIAIAGTDNQWVSTYSVTYSHHKSKLQETINNIKGATGPGINNKFRYFFDKPIIATNLIIRPVSKGNEHIPAKLIVELYGSNVNDIQESILLDKNKKAFCKDPENEACGSISDLLNKQSQIQQLCDALDQQEQIKQNNIRLDRNKKYLLELEDQDRKIKELETVINKMKEIRTARQQQNDSRVLTEKSSQQAMEDKLKALVEERRKNQKSIKLNLNVKEGFTVEQVGGPAQFIKLQ